MAADNFCPNCCLWHPGVPCDHQPETLCLNNCGRPRGMRWLGDDRLEVKPRTRCWHCWWASVGHPPLPLMVKCLPADDAEEAA